jgi:hypothetical protein
MKKFAYFLATFLVLGFAFFVFKTNAISLLGGTITNLNGCGLWPSNPSCHQGGSCNPYTGICTTGTNQYMYKFRCQGRLTECRSDQMYYNFQGSSNITTDCPVGYTCQIDVFNTKCRPDGQPHGTWMCGSPTDYIVWYNGGSTQSTCSYASTQARFHTHQDGTLRQSLTVNSGTEVKAVGVHNQNATYWPDTRLQISGPNGYVYNCDSQCWFTPPTAGSYTLKVTTNGQSGPNCEDQAYLTVQGYLPPPPPPSNNQCSAQLITPPSSQHVQVQPGTNYTVTGWASDNDGINRVEVHIGGAHRGNANLINANGRINFSYIYTVPYSTVSERIEIRAYDNYGNLDPTCVQFGYVSTQIAPPPPPQPNLPNLCTRDCSRSTCRDPIFQDLGYLKFGSSRDQLMYKSIDTLECLQVINGFSDGNFRANWDVSRAQMAQFIARGFRIPEFKDGECAREDFYDVPKGHHFYTSIKTLQCWGIVDGAPRQIFDTRTNSYRTVYMYYPDSSITRGDTARIMVLAARRVTDDPSFFNDTQPHIQVYHDVPIGSYGSPNTPFMQGLYRAGVNDPNYYPYFQPGKNISRGEMSIMMYLAIGPVYERILHKPTY